MLSERSNPGLQNTLVGRSSEYKATIWKFMKLHCRHNSSLCYLARDRISNPACSDTRIIVFQLHSIAIGHSSTASAVPTRPSGESLFDSLCCCPEAVVVGGHSKLTQIIQLSLLSFLHELHRRLRGGVLQPVRFPAVPLSRS